MADTVDPKFLDKRTADRYLRSGQLEDKAYERYLKSLPDVADKAVPVETMMLSDGEEFDDEDDIEDEEEDEGEEDEGEEDEDEGEEDEGEDEKEGGEDTPDEGPATA